MYSGCHLVFWEIENFLGTTFSSGGGMGGQHVRGLEWIKFSVICEKHLGTTCRLIISCGGYNIA